MHVPPLGPVYPALHRQLLDPVLAAAEKEFARQLSQAALPDTDLYLPLTQATHEPPLGPVYPALHRQLLDAILPASELELAEQLLQAALPGIDLYLPLTH